MNKDWESIKQEWCQTHSDVDPIVLEHLYNHAVTLEEVAHILQPNYEEGLHDPSLLPDIDKAATRLLAAMAADETILVFTDYDADGLPGAAIVDTFFKKIGYENYALQTPDRNVDGFGLKPQHVQRALESGVDLILTIDCGSASIEALRLANQHQLDVIVTDHHEVPPLDADTTPFALVNPMSKESNYPYPHICGAVVAFKLVQYLITVGKNEASSIQSLNEGWDKWLLDLAAIATVGDMMPLLDENRVIVSYGLKVLNQTRNYGLRALIDSAKPGHVAQSGLCRRYPELVG